MPQWRCVHVRELGAQEDLVLSLVDHRHSRRDFLTVGSLALGGLTLADLLVARAIARAAGRPVTDKSVIFLFLHGGPPQTELFDPKMTAPRGIRSVTGEAQTTLSGVTYGGTLTKLARWAHKLAVVRSFTTGNGNHDIKPIVGRHTGGANIGSLYSRIAGTNHSVTGMPLNVALFPRAVDPKAQKANQSFGKFGSTGTLGAAYAPFVPGGGGHLQQNMQLNIARERLGDRRGLLRRLDRMRRDADSSGYFTGLSRFREQAFDTILGGVSAAFDLSREDPRVVERYDTSPLVPRDSISKKWNNHKNYADNAHTLGRLMLMARRLCEAGCGFVTVTTNFVWDMHADRNNATIEEGMRYCGVPFDHAVSAFIEDIEARGLSDKILLVACGEMGRTPRVNKRGGRDHWGGLAPLLLYGGGLRGGQVIGQSTRDAGRPASDPVTMDHLLATILHVLCDVGTLRVTRGVPPEIMRVIEKNRPIPGLV